MCMYLETDRQTEIEPEGEKRERGRDAGSDR
jgi:hypothetical protein